MSKRLRLLALALGLVAAACSTPSHATVDLGSGTRFVPEVADSLNDAGLFPSVAVTDDGQPYVAYFGFQEKLPEGTVGAPRLIGLPSIPGVMLATVKDGIWTRGAIAIVASIPNVSVAFGPATDDSVGNLTHDNVTGLQLVADPQGGLHAAWGAASGLWYASGSADPNSTTPWTLEHVSATPPLGLSLALDAGTPWIAYYTSNGPGAEVTLATKSGDRWTSGVVSSAASCATCRTVVLPLRERPPVVVFAGGNRVWMATNVGGKSWETQDLGPGGEGLSGTVDADGDVWLSYYSGTDVKVATGAVGALHASTAATVGEGSATTAGARTSIDVDDNGTYTLGWTDSQGQVTTIGLGTGEAGKPATPIATADSTGGSSPSVASTPDGSSSFVAWYAASAGKAVSGVVPGHDLILGTYSDVQELGLAVQSPTPTATTAPSTSPTPSQSCEQADASNTVQVVALGIAFTPETSCIEVKAGTPFTIHFDNQDAGTQHDVAIFTADDLTTVLFQPPDLLTGPAQVDYSVDALDKGEYFFHCDVHPTMTGQVVVR